MILSSAASFVGRKEDKEWSRLLWKAADKKLFSMFRLSIFFSRAAERAGMGLMLQRSSTRSMILPCLPFLAMSSSSISVPLLKSKNISLGVKGIWGLATWSFYPQERRQAGTWSEREKCAICIFTSPPLSSTRSPHRRISILIAWRRVGER